MQKELQDLQHARDRAQQRPRQPPVPTSRVTARPRTQKTTAFVEGKYGMDSYLLRFERYAGSQEWDKRYWATGLSLLLQGKALDVYALMPKEDALSYDQLKCSLLKRYELAKEGFRRKYNKRKPYSCETFQLFFIKDEGML